MAEVYVQIEQLDATANPQRDHQIAAQRGGQTVRLSVEQINKLTQIGDISGLSNQLADRLSRVTTLAAAAAIASPPPIIWVDDYSRGGAFVLVDVADYTDLIAADTVNGVIRVLDAPNDTKAWMRIATAERDALWGSWFGIGPEAGTADIDADLRVMVDVAALLGKGMEFPRGKRTWSPASQLLLQGVPFWRGHGTEFDLGGSSHLSPIKALGSKVLLASALTLANGAGVIDITGAAELPEKGQTIFITSNEQHPQYNGAQSRFYYKGTRTSVDSLVWELGFDGQTANFALGETVTGAGGATGIVAYQTDSGTSGTLGLIKVQGTFVDNEALTGSLGGAAVVNSPSGPAIKMRVFPQVDFSYTASAYVWAVEEQPFDFDGISLKGNKNLNQSGIIATMCDARVGDAAKFYNLPQAACRFEQSRGRFEGSCYGNYGEGVLSGTHYGAVSSDLSDVDVIGAFINIDRHAATLGGGTMNLSEMGLPAGNAAYPGSLKVTGGTYGSSRTGRTFPDDPSLETGAIDCHGIGKLLVVGGGAVVYGGFKLAPIESCLIGPCVVYNRDYASFTFVDTVAPAWGSIKIIGADVMYIGDDDAASTPASAPKFFLGGSTDQWYHLEVSGCTFRAPGCVLSADASLGIIRNAEFVVFEDNTIDIELDAANRSANLEFYCGERAVISGNTLRGVGLTLRPNHLNTVLNFDDNTVEGAGTATAAVVFTNNNLMSTARFANILCADNLVQGAYNGGMFWRGDVVKQLTRKNNTVINCNLGGSAADTIGSAFVFARIAGSTDPLTILIDDGNTAITEATAAAAHRYGFWTQTGSTINTDIYSKGNTSHGHSVAAALTLNVTGNTVRECLDNTGLTRSGAAGSPYLTGTATYDPASIAAGAQVTTTITVTGAALGDLVTSVSFSLDLQGIQLTAYVSGANTVTAVFRNGTAGAIDLASGTLRSLVEKV